MTHDEAAHLLLEHAEGRLSGPTRAQVEEHVRSCAECEALLRSCRVLAEGFLADAGPEGTEPPAHGHPPIEDLVEFALGHGQREDATRTGVAAHLEACTACVGDVEAVRAARAEAASVRPRAAARAGWRAASLLHPALPASLAAGFAFFAMAYPAYLGLSVLPKVKARAETLMAESRATEDRLQEMARNLEENQEERRRIAGWSGPITVPLLSAPVRGGSFEETTIPVGRNQPFVCLVIDPGVPPSGIGGGDYVFRIFNPDGASIWSAGLAPSEVRRRLSQSGSLAFLIPSGDLRPGRYRLRIAREEPGPGAPSLDFPFAVARVD